ncbi:MAG: threonine--tRNA ligase [Simkaniaceae bacterium]
MKNGAAEYLAAAFHRMYPKAVPLSGSASNHAFFYDFLISEKISKKDLSFIDEAMHALCKEKAKRYEMLGENAAAFLREMGEAAKAKTAERYTGRLIYIFQLGGFFDVCLEDFHLDMESLAFKIQEYEDRGSVVKNKKDYFCIRIIGYAFSSSEILQDYLKEVKTFHKYSHNVLGEKLGIFSVHYRAGIKEFLWKNRGESFLHLLEDFWRSHMKCLGYSLSASLPEDFPQKPNKHFWNELKKERKLWSPLIVALKGEKKWAEPDRSSNASLFELAKECIDRVYILCFSVEMKRQKENLEKAIKDFFHLLSIPIEFTSGAEKKRRFSNKGKEPFKENYGREEDSGRNIYFTDSYGQKQRLGFIRCHKLPEEEVLLEASFIHSFERLAAALLETWRGGLPFWLAPEQLRILPMVEDPEIFTLQKNLLSKNFRVDIDCSRQSLKEKIKEAQKVKVPFLLIFGKNEQEKRTALIQNSSGEKQEIPLEKLAHWLEIKQITR